MIPLEMLRAGYGRESLLDAARDEVMFGRSLAEHAEDFVGKSAGALANQIAVCPIESDSTSTETCFVGLCLQRFRARRILLVRFDYHARRTLTIFKKRGRASC